MTTNWAPESWRQRPVLQAPDFPDAARLAHVEERHQGLPAARLRRRGAQAQAQARPRGGGQGVPAAGRRLRRELRGAFGRQHPRLLPRLPADGGGPDLRRRPAGGEGRPHRRPVRQAALVADGEDRRAASCRAIAATSSTTSPSRPRRACPIPSGRSWPTASRPRRSTCSAPSRSGGYANLEHVHRWTLGLPRRFPRQREIPGARRPHHRGAGLHARLRHQPRHRAAAALDRFLHEPRGAAARLRAGDDPRRFDERRLVRHLRPHAVDRRPHAPAGRRPCRILPRHQQPDRHQMRPDARRRPSS